MAYTLIDIGPGLGSLGLSGSALYTYIDTMNPANASGTLYLVSLWFNVNTTGVKVGTFYGSGTDYSLRDYVTIGNVAGGSQQSFDVIIPVVIGDFLGLYWATGGLGYSTAGGTAVYYRNEDDFHAGLHTYTKLNLYRFADYGTGFTARYYIHARRDRMNLRGVSTQNILL